VIGNDFEHSYELCVISVCHHDSAAGADASKLKSAEAHGSRWSKGKTIVFVFKNNFEK
jgi:hypothetical protein